MPSTSQLQWQDISDFTAGIWDEQGAYNKFAAPSSAFILLTDYQPMKGGGLRPFFGFTALTTPSFTTTESVMGVFARNGLVRTGAGGTGNAASDIVMVTIDTATNFFNIYRLDNTVGAPAWSLRFSSASGWATDGHQAVQFALFFDNTNDNYLMSINVNNGVRGLYVMQVDTTVASNTGNDGKVTKLQAYYGPLAVSQQRILIGAGNSSTLEYGDVGATSFSAAPASGFIRIDPYKEEAAIMSINAVAPSDLLIGKEGAPWVEVNGDITSQPPRGVGRDHVPRYAAQQCPQTPGGVAFIESGGRVFETDGRTFKPLTNMLGGRPLSRANGMVGPGTMAYFNGYLTIPEAESATTTAVYDYESGALFRMSALNGVFGWADPYGGQFYLANNLAGANAIFGTVDILGGSRVTTGVIQTVPYADQNGRNIDIREVQLFSLIKSACEFKVELLDETDSSVVTKYAYEVAGRQVTKLQFPATKSDYLSVKITPRMLNGSDEAPTIERLRIGFGINNLVRL